MGHSFARKRLHRIRPRRSQHVRVERQCAGPPASNKDLCWGVERFASGAGSAKPTLASYGADGTLPPASTRQVPKRAQTMGQKDASRATASRAGRNRRGRGGGLNSGRRGPSLKRNAHAPQVAARAHVSAYERLLVNLALHRHVSISGLASFGIRVPVQCL
jgi:hypothetical protein